MIKIGYFNEKVLHIDDYDPAIHKDMVRCEEGHILIAKQGDVRMHHFCHRANDVNACGSSGMGNWHIWWQKRLLPKNIEFRFNKNEMLKIADTINIIGPNKDILSIVEYQNSKMSIEEFELREAFYTRRDLMAQWGLPDCTATLTWVFNLKDCDIEIDHVFGNVVCFRWLKGSKYMLNAKARTFYDLGKRQLLQIKGIHKPKIIETKFVAVIWSLEQFDNFYFKDVLKPDLSVDQKRLNVHLLVNDCAYIENEIKLETVVEMCKAFYFKGKDTKTKSKTKKSVKSNLPDYSKITERNIKEFISNK